MARARNKIRQRADQKKERVKDTNARPAAANVRSIGPSSTSVRILSVIRKLRGSWITPKKVEAASPWKDGWRRVARVGTSISAWSASPSDGGARPADHEAPESGLAWGDFLETPRGRGVQARAPAPWASSETWWEISRELRALGPNAQTSMDADDIKDLEWEKLAEHMRDWISSAQKVLELYRKALEPPSSARTPQTSATPMSAAGTALQSPSSAVSSTPVGRRLIFGASPASTSSRLADGTPEADLSPLNMSTAGVQGCLGYERGKSPHRKRTLRKYRTEAPTRVRETHATPTETRPQTPPPSANHFLQRLAEVEVDDAQIAQHRQGAAAGHDTLPQDWSTQELCPGSIGHKSIGSGPPEGSGTKHVLHVCSPASSVSPVAGSRKEYGRSSMPSERQEDIRKSMSPLGTELSSLRLKEKTRKLKLNMAAVPAYSEPELQFDDDLMVGLDNRSGCMKVTPTKLRPRHPEKSMSANRGKNPPAQQSEGINSHRKASERSSAASGAPPPPVGSRRIARSISMPVARGLVAQSEPKLEPPQDNSPTAISPKQPRGSQVAAVSSAFLAKCGFPKVLTSLAHNGLALAASNCLVPTRQHLLLEMYSLTQHCAVMVENVLPPGAHAVPHNQWKLELPAALGDVFMHCFDAFTQKVESKCQCRRGTGRFSTILRRLSSCRRGHEMALINFLEKGGQSQRSHGPEGSRPRPIRRLPFVANVVDHLLDLSLNHKDEVNTIFQLRQYLGQVRTLEQEVSRMVGLLWEYAEAEALQEEDAAFQALLLLNQASKLTQLEAVSGIPEARRQMRRHLIPLTVRLSAVTLKELLESVKVPRDQPYSCLSDEDIETRLANFNMCVERLCRQQLELDFDSDETRLRVKNMWSADITIAYDTFLKQYRVDPQSHPSYIWDPEELKVFINKKFFSRRSTSVLGF